MNRNTSFRQGIQGRGSTYKARGAFGIANIDNGGFLLRQGRAYVGSAISRDVHQCVGHDAAKCRYSFASATIYQQTGG